ncbi:hypothetical protein M885DRAFT_510158 [Pelagophyceae sp. CCMP2097]|nr:hypothetical protein M885DRAFT_510158 [Pelagophyceae sp. CCMP2097]
MLRAIRAAAAKFEVAETLANLKKKLSRERMDTPPAPPKPSKKHKEEHKEGDPFLERRPQADKPDSSCHHRHFGTDALLGSWCLLFASMLYALYGAELVTEAWLSTSATAVAYAWGNALSGLLFTVGAAYFVNLSYPEELERCAHEALSCDVASLSFVEKTFTFNDMLIATWAFECACIPYVGIAVAYIAAGALDGNVDKLLLGCLMLFASFGLMACIYVWVLAAMPQYMQHNGGKGSSRFYDELAQPLFGRCCDRALRRHVGTDLQAGGWLFFGPCVFGSVFTVGLVFTDPTNMDKWSFLIQGALLAVGAGLLLRSMYPPVAAEAPLLP